MPGDWNPITAFHHLTALSQVACWFRHCDVHRSVLPPDFSAANAVLRQMIKAQTQTQKALTPPTE